mgnify:CR=1 FL=1|tara:strand:- start:214 stop:1755 length:1542 start_codon:yes stop_codon:yes gene_type:complete
MADGLNTFLSISAGGLITNVDPLTQASSLSGSAIRMINYEPSLAGGYRRISGYQNNYGTVPGSGAVLGVHVNGNLNDGIFACRKPLSGYNYLHKWNNTSSSWDAITTAGSPNTTNVSRVRFSEFNWSGEILLLTDGVNPAAIYDGTTYTQITGSNAAADPKFSEEYSSHIFLAGDSTNPFNLYFSAPLNAIDFTPANGAGVINVGFKITAIKKFRDDLFIFGANNIKKLTGNNIANFVLQNVTANLGCVAPDSVVEFGGDLLFLGPDGIRPISGTDRIGDVELAPVSKEIQDIFDNYYLSEQVTDISIVVIRKKSQFRFFFKNDSSLSLIGAIRKSQNKQSIFEYSQLIGIEANCVASGYIGQFEFILHGDGGGKVYRQETGTSFAGDNIFSLYQTPYFYMEDPEMRKVVYKVNTYLKSEGSTEVFVGVSYDYDDTNTLNPTTYSFSTEGAAALYGTAIYGAGDIYDGNPSPKALTNVSGSGNSVSISYVTNNTNASHTIQAISITYSLEDRR